MKITESTILTPGRYTRAGNHNPELPIIEVEADGVVLDMAGAVLYSEDFSRGGILVRGWSDVTIRNGIIRGFYQGLQIENCVVSDNHNPVDAGWLADKANPSEDGFGGGIHLSHVMDSLIEGNTTTSPPVSVLGQHYRGQPSRPLHSFCWAFLERHCGLGKHLAGGVFPSQSDRGQQSAIRRRRFLH